MTSGRFCVLETILRIFSRLFIFLKNSEIYVLNCDTIFTQLSAAPERALPQKQRRTNYFQMRLLIEALSDLLKTLI